MPIVGSMQRALEINTSYLKVKKLNLLKFKKIKLLKSTNYFICETYKFDKILKVKILFILLNKMYLFLIIQKCTMSGGIVL